MASQDAPVTVTIESTVDPEWFEFCASSDVFRRTHCGYWARGVEFHPERGWLVWDDIGDEKSAEPSNKRAALAAWRDGKPLPPHWFRLDRETAIKAWAIGVRWRGESWYSDGDAHSCDYALQMALLGENKYG